MAKVLLVEDEQSLTDYIKTFLEKKGVEVIITDRGDLALELCCKERPDIVLLDLGLPDMDGREVLQKIKNKDTQIKVVVMSGYSDPFTRKELLSLGADYFLGKPIISTKVYNLIEEILKGKNG